MLTLTIKGQEFFDDKKQEFVETKSTTISMEHSLVSLTQWESKWKLSFLATKDKTTEQTIDYLRMMTLTPNVPDDLFETISNEDLRIIYEYIGDVQTATTFSELGTKTVSREIVTSEVIYGWMASMQVDFECQYWHLSRLITLLKVMSAKNAPPEKRSASDLAARNRALNKQRQAEWGGPG